jgi:hypothetical protein
MKPAHKEDRKEFAAMVSRPRTDDTYFEDDVGPAFSISSYSREGIASFTTRIFQKVDCSQLEGINWLYKEGYTTREDSLGAIYDVSNNELLDLQVI